MADLVALRAEFAQIGLDLNFAKCELFINNTLPEDTQQSIAQDFKTCAPGIKFLTKETATLLGAPLTDEAFPHFVQKQIDTYKESADRLMEINSHMALHIIKYCLFLPKFMYVLRCCHMWKCLNLLKPLDELIRTSLSKVLNCTFSERAWDQATLPVRFGGLGVRRTAAVALPAFLSSGFACEKLYGKIIYPALGPVEVSHLSEAKNAWQQACSDELPRAAWVQKRWDEPFCKKVQESLLENCPNQTDRARLLASQMADETDFNDVLDNIFLREESQHKESYEEGFKAGSLAGNPEGYHLGYHRGAELGRELGYYYGTVLEYLTANESAESKYPEKLLNQLTKLKDLIEAFPKDNCEDQDILGMADNIRAQYKKACALLKISSANPYEAGMRFFLKMDSTINKIHHALDSTLEYLTPLLPVANCHMVEFLTQNHWHKLLPKSLTESLDCLELNDAVENFWDSAKNAHNGNTELNNWVKNAHKHYIKANNVYCLTREQLQDRIRGWGGEIKPDFKVKEFMTSKKSYEVQTMCGLVASLHAASGCTCCVEAGGGRGPLLAPLALSYGVPSLTVDCDIRSVASAEKRARIMKNQWHAIAERVGGGVGSTVETPPSRRGDLHRFATAFVTSQTDLAAIVRDLFPEYGEDVKLLLTGLHTCGNLGPDSLRIFTAQPSTRAVFNVPCCYHLLSEQIDDGLFDMFQRDFGNGVQVDAGFPMSQYLKGMTLGRNARMLAAQSIDRVLHAKQLPNRSLIYRAMLQVIITEHLPKAPLSEGKLKRLSKCKTSCNTFEQYFKVADSILQLKLFDTLSDSYLNELNKKMEGHWKNLVMFYLLRLCLAQVIESVILTGSLVIGYVSLFISACSLAGVSFSLFKIVDYMNKHNSNRPPGGHSPQEVKNTALSLYISHAYFLLVLLYYTMISVLLIVGVHRNKSNYLRYYCNAVLMLLALAIALVVVTLVFFGFIVTLPLLKWCIILFYCLIVVRSRYHEMEELNRPQAYELKNLHDPEQVAPVV
ncbi:methyltransferase domain-containing protein [Phthorimaea operculella]|nr:methyltransferase domain-containing protein [Phthorimaea operculella]